MDWIHKEGISFIQFIQSSFKGESEAMVFTSHLGDPRNAFLLYFPLAYWCCPVVGIQVMWVAVLSEWLNAVLKWLLYGHRPYWWVHETPLYKKVPHLEQFRLTCETGPGSPSGHAMVTSAVLFIMVTALIHRKLTKAPCRLILTAVVWTLYVFFITAVNVSRCYISAHFPHQVLMGTVTGIIIAVVSLRLSVSSCTLRHYIMAVAALTIIGAIVYIFLLTVGLNPLWSMQLAEKYCASKKWLHLETTLFYAMIRDISSLIGLGFALHKIGYQVPVLVEGQSEMTAECGQGSSQPEITSTLHKLLGVTLSLIVTQLSQYITLPHEPLFLFYCLAFTKNFLLVYLVVAFIPKLCHMITRHRSAADKIKES